MRPTIRRWSKGDAVAEAHAVLAAQGFQPGKLGKTPLFNAAMHRATVHFQETHLDEDGQPLVVDGWIGEKTWWALDHPDGEAQSLGVPLHTPGVLHGDRLKLIDLAQSHHGVKEIPNGSNRGDLIDTWTRWTDARGKKGPPWCAYFVSKMVHGVVGSWPLGGRIGSCYQSMRRAKARGMYRDRNAGPTPGDQFVMLYTARGGKLTYRGHTGLVTAVSEDETQIATIEGNCANRVARRIRPVSSMHGFIEYFEPCDFEPGLPAGVKVIGGESTR